ncbi:MAG: dienelactone hydrolase [Lysobacterales bacterium CG02_land_8_20_14_3_00_62_12]|nr:MAG: dienelactone hydrolase [Xanthomonadales bacterium CG02_land_8_20_14_3_00_62_12]
MRILCFALLLLCAMPTLAKPIAKSVEWGHKNVEMQGYLVYDDASTRLRPGLVMVPNWMGVTDAAVEKAKAMAGADYVILLVDMYGKGQRPKDASEAAAMTSALYGDLPTLRGRIIAAVEALRAQVRNEAPLDTLQLGAIGFCFGGSTVLELARAGDEEAINGTALAGIVSFHGGLSTSQPATEGQVKTSLLVLNGAADSNVSAADIDAFGKEMTAAKADWQFVNFGGAHHCFAEADANRPPNCLYHEPSAKRALRMMHDFFDERFANLPVR